MRCRTGRGAMRHSGVPCYLVNLLLCNILLCFECGTGRPDPIQPFYIRIEPFVFRCPDTGAEKFHGSDFFVIFALDA